MTESGLSGEPGLRVLAVVEQQLGPGPDSAMILLQITRGSSVLGDLIKQLAVVLQVVSVRILVSGMSMSKPKIYSVELGVPQYFSLK